LAVCRWHANRFRDAVESIPEFLAHLREIGKPFAEASPPADMLVPGAPEERSQLPAAWLAADEISNELLGWVRATVEESPRRLTWPNHLPWRGDLAAWMIDHLRNALGLPFAGEMVHEFCEMVDTARHRWPTADDTLPVVKLPTPCPSCGMTALIRKPPRYAQDPRRIECTDPNCSRIYTENEYDALLEIALRDGRAGKWRVVNRSTYGEKTKTKEPNTERITCHA